MKLAVQQREGKPHMRAATWSLLTDYGKGVREVKRKWLSIEEQNIGDLKNSPPIYTNNNNNTELLFCL